MYQNIETIQSFIRLIGSNVVDVGGGIYPFPTAKVVVDRTWQHPTDYYSSMKQVTMNLDEAPLPFSDNEFDFCVCTHTLEDCSNAPFVGSEVFRIARAGYIEVPHRLEELSLGVSGNGNKRGWDHHHWVCDVSHDTLFVCKKELVLPKYTYDGDHPRFIAMFWVKEDVNQLVSEVEVDPIVWNRTNTFGEIINTEGPSGVAEGEHVFTPTIMRL